jgi:integrase
MGNLTAEGAQAGPKPTRGMYSYPDADPLGGGAIARPSTKRAVTLGLALLSLSEIFYRCLKTGKRFYRPMNRTVHAHIKSIMPEDADPDAPVFPGGGARPNKRFRTLCGLASIGPKMNVETGEERPSVLKDLRKTCATYYDEHVPESSVEILGHSAGGVTYRHYAHRAPLAFKAIMTIP